MALSNTQYDSLKKDYDSRRLRAFHVANTNKQELYKKDPNLQKIDQSIAALSVKHAEQLLNGDKNAVKTLISSLSSLNKEKEERIANLGFDEDYIEPSFSCPDCRDTGYINGERCHCFKQAALDIMYDQSNLRSVLTRENFKKFDYNLFSDDESDAIDGMTPYMAMKQAVIKCRAFIDNFEDNHGNLFIFGPTGVGKTFLSNCVAKEMLDRGKSVVYFSAVKLFDVFRENSYNKDLDAQSAYQSIFNCDLLIIDDLGTEISNAYTISQLFMCINERLLRRRSTIISTNLSLTGLRDLYTERTFSRISKDYEFVKLFGADIRMKIS